MAGRWRVATRYWVRTAGAGEPGGTAGAGGRALRAAADDDPILRLGEATGGGGAFGSRVGRSMRGSGVESGMVGATP